MEPVLLGRTVRFHPCLQKKEEGRHRLVGGMPRSPQNVDNRDQLYLENGSDFPTGNPLP